MIKVSIEGKEAVEGKFVVVLALQEDEDSTQTITQITGSISGEGLRDGYVDHFKSLLKMNKNVTPRAMKDFLCNALGHALHELEGE